MRRHLVVFVAALGLCAGCGAVQVVSCPSADRRAPTEGARKAPEAGGPNGPAAPSPTPSTETP